MARQSSCAGTCLKITSTVSRRPKWNWVQITEQSAAPFHNSHRAFRIPPRNNRIAQATDEGTSGTKPHWPLPFS